MKRLFLFENNLGFDPTFLLRKKSLTNENSAKGRFVRKNPQVKTGLIGQVNRSKVVYLSADPNVGPFQGRFPLVC